MRAGGSAWVGWMTTLYLLMVRSRDNGEVKGKTPTGLNVEAHMHTVGSAWVGWMTTLYLLMVRGMGVWDNGGD